MSDVEQITDGQVEALRDEAGAAGDKLQVQLCGRTLDGDATARRMCWQAIEEAKARAGTEVSTDDNH